MATSEMENQGAMAHKLPKAPLVDRIDFLVGEARTKRVIHVGFVDTGCRTLHQRKNAWLHAHLDEVASSLVGIDVDEIGVKDAEAAGYEAYTADCRDSEQLTALGIEPAQLVIAGEVIEHIDDPGAFLDGLQALVAPGGRLIVTTPNAYGLFNVVASLAHREINHPDHVLMFTWQTLTNLASRYGWAPVETHVYVPVVKGAPGQGIGAKAVGLIGRGTVGLERLLAKLGRGYAADGMIIAFRSTR